MRLAGKYTFNFIFYQLKFAKDQKMK